jgi:uncharacterized membrane protein (DUF106 family)
MRLTFKPMIVSLILVILVLPVIRDSYTGKVVGTVPNVLPAVGGIKLDWFWWYFVSTFVISLIAKKILGI